VTFNKTLLSFLGELTPLVREVPKVLHTTHRRKIDWGSRLIADLDSKKCKNVTMDNPQSRRSMSLCQTVRKVQRLYGNVRDEIDTLK